MKDQKTIQDITAALDGAPLDVQPGAGVFLEGAETYPYFVPFRYAAARASYLAAGITPGLLTSIQPYMGNWMLFCDFLKQDQQRPEAADTEKNAGEIIANAALPVPTEEAEQIVAETLPEPQIQANEVVVMAEEVAAVPEPDVATETTVAATTESEKDLLVPVYSHDYFLHEGEKIPEELTFELGDLKPERTRTEEEKSLMVVMSFTEWLLHFKQSAEKQEEETKEKKALKTMWQKEKLAAALEEENEEIPEGVFEMAVNSISKEDGVASETLAEIYVKQGKYDHAVEMFRKLSLLYPQKNTYFARKIEEALKNKQL